MASASLRYFSFYLPIFLLTNAGVERLQRCVSDYLPHQTRRGQIYFDSYDNKNIR